MANQKLELAKFVETMWEGKYIVAKKQGTWEYVGRARGIEAAVILAVDVRVDEARFAGERIIRAGSQDAIRNAAGLIASATALPMDQAAEKVYQTVGRIMAVAEQYHKPPHVVARKMAARRIELIGSLGRA